ncbi:oxidoreductase [Tundrisphaera sp. TA3]|uniref:oxidoreductase n=1 Tax=Tundrisphaera sp. TA3 TaxID=3435775 RepID=UPI003EBC5C4C
MAKLPNPDERDPTLDAADRALEAESLKELPRGYIGMSSVGEACSRMLYYRFRWAWRETFDAETLKLFDDGHRTEDLVIARLKLASQLTVVDRDPATGEQIRHRDLDGHFSGGQDGEILGLLQAPKTRHILEVKATREKKFNELKAIIRKVGQKAALRVWNPVYYAQAVLYMYYRGLTRHYTVVSTPGGRDWLGLRTEADTAFALQLRAKAQRIIKASEPPIRIGSSSDCEDCRYCKFTGICHDDVPPLRNCRTCLHSTPVEQGGWHCARWDKPLTVDDQREGCPVHLYIPGLVAGEVLDAGDSWVRYRMRDGSEFIDSEA